MAQTTESASTSATTKEGVQIKGKDVILLNAPEVRLSPDTPLLTEAQDVAGAINELFMLDPGGSDDKWIRPSDWPVLPEPTANQIIMLITTQWNTSPNESFYIQAYGYGETTKYFGDGKVLTVDWGDGTVENVALPADSKTYSMQHYFYNRDTNTWNTGPVLKNGAHVFVVKITMPEDTYFYYNHHSEPLDMHIGANVKFYGRIAQCNMLEHIKFFDWVPTDKNCYPKGAQFGNNPALHSVDTTVPFTAIKSSMFAYCTRLTEFDLSQCTEMQNNAFSDCHNLKKINAPLLTTIGDYAFNNCYALKAVQASSLLSIGNHAFYNCLSLKTMDSPNLLTVGDYAFNSCRNLSDISHDDYWTYGSNAFNYCYKYYDNPQMSHPDLN